MENKPLSPSAEAAEVPSRRRQSKNPNRSSKNPRSRSQRRGSPEHAADKSSPRHRHRSRSETRRDRIDRAKKSSEKNESPSAQQAKRRPAHLRAYPSSKERVSRGESSEGVYFTWRRNKERSATIHRSDLTTLGKVAAILDSNEQKRQTLVRSKSQELEGKRKPTHRRCKSRD